MLLLIGIVVVGIVMIITMAALPGPGGKNVSFSMSMPSMAGYI